MNEMAASVEQVTANTASLAASVAETAASAQETTASIRSVAATAEEMATASQQVAASITEMASSTKTVSRDTESLTASVNETARRHRGDVALDRGRRRQCRPISPRPTEETTVVDQRDGGVDRGSRGDDREPGDGRRAELHRGRADGADGPVGRGQRPRHQRCRAQCVDERHPARSFDPVDCRARQAGRRGHAPRLARRRGRRRDRFSARSRASAGCASRCCSRPR